MRKVLLSLLSLLTLSCEENVDNIKLVTFELEEILKLELEENNFITQFEYDHEDVLWVGTFNGGVLKVGTEGVTRFSTENSPIGDGRINDIFIDHHNKVWIATDRGASVFDGEDWFTYNMSNAPLFQGFVSEVAVNQFDQVLIGNGVAGKGGLLLYEEGEWQSFTPENSILPSNIINEIEIDNTGDFWIGTSMYMGRGGIVKISQGTVEKVFNSNQGFLYNAVDNLEINDSTIWLGYEVYYLDEVGYPDGGIQQINKEGIVLGSWFPADTKAVSNRVNNMMLSSMGELWFTTINDDCINCINGIGVLSNEKKFDVLSAVNYAIESNIYITCITEHPQEGIHIAQEDKIYKVKRR